MNKIILILSALILQLSFFGQEIVRQDNYYDYKIGIYKTKSTDQDLIALKVPVIAPQTQFAEGEKTAFLKVENKGIALFDKINDSGRKKPVGVLAETSVVRVDTIFYQEIFSDTTKEWWLTFNVWYAISINGQRYYTDCQVHDFIAFKKKIDTYDQEFLLVSKSTGYDGYYDVGYPNFFFVAVLNGKNELIYNSEVLDFDYGDEFWEESVVSAKSTDIGFEFTIIGLEQKLTATWTGKVLKQ